MPNPSGYESVLSARASASLVGLSRPRQKQALRLLLQLAEHPSQLGDYATRGEDGREIQHLLIGDWHFSFWADHAVRELRIIEIDNL
jgi:hypothetical protein